MAPVPAPGAGHHNPNMFHSIAALRALAAFWVLAAHCMIWGGWYGVPLPSPKYAVDLFMMISGFLMVAQADARGTAEPLSQGRNRLRFWLRRYFRLAPAYYLALGLAVVTAPYFLAGYQALQDLNPSAWEHEAVNRPASIEPWLVVGRPPGATPRCRPGNTRPSTGPRRSSIRSAMSCSI